MSSCTASDELGVPLTKAPAQPSPVGAHAARLTVSGLRVSAFHTPWGTGHIALSDDLPFELELPDGAAGRVSTGLEVRAGSPGADGLATGSARSVPGQSERLWAVLLERYFGGEPVAFPLDVHQFCRAHGFTAFECSVYHALAHVPYATPVSYRDLAVAAGRPLAWRAVGSAMALNPLPVVLPCHRVVRSDGTLGQYGEDPRWKRRLLELEGVKVVGGKGAPASQGRLASPALVHTSQGGRR